MMFVGIVVVGIVELEVGIVVAVEVAVAIEVEVDMIVVPMGKTMAIFRRRKMVYFAPASAIMIFFLNFVLSIDRMNCTFEIYFYLSLKCFT